MLLCFTMVCCHPLSIRLESLCLPFGVFVFCDFVSANVYFCYFYFQAILLSRTNRLSEAVNILKGLVRDDPQNLAHYKTLAGMYAQKGQVKDVRCCPFLFVIFSRFLISVNLLFPAWDCFWRVDGLECDKSSSIKVVLHETIRNDYF